MTPEQLAAIRERVAAATPGAWVMREYNNPLNELGVTTFGNPHETNLVYSVETKWEQGQLHRPLGIMEIAFSPYYEKAAAPHIRKEDAQFIAHARTDIPELLSYVDALQSRIDKMLTGVELARPLLVFGDSELDHHVSCVLSAIRDAGKVQP